MKSFSLTVNVKNACNAAAFYVKNFGGKITFDAEWYVAVKLGAQDICFMQPQTLECELYTGGLTFNLEVEDVDAEYRRLQKLGIKLYGTPEDHPWGDRAFVASDDVGVSLYIYALRPMTPEFQQCVKKD